MRAEIVELDSRRSMNWVGSAIGIWCNPATSRAVLVLAGVVVGSFACFGPMDHAGAQEWPGNRFVGYFSPSLALRGAISSDAAWTQVSEGAATEALLRNRVLVLAPTATTTVDRWVRFEQEYGVDQTSPLVMGRMMQRVKYMLDTMCFSAQETEKLLEFTYTFGDEPPTSLGTGMAQPRYALPMFGRFGPAQLRSEITLHDPRIGRAFLGLILTIPFGPGGHTMVLADGSRSPLSPIPE